MKTREELQDILYHLDCWNETNAAAQHRNDMRSLLGWKTGGPKLSTLLVDLIKEIEIPKLLPPPDTKSKDYTVLELENLIRDTYHGKVPISELSTQILQSNWDMTDRRLTKDAFEVRDFLEERSNDPDDGWDYLSDGAQRFFKVICNAYRSWYERQYKSTR